MAQCIKHNFIKHRQKQLLLAASFLCLSPLLSGCNGNHLTHINDAFKNPIASIEKNMDDETSHMAPPPMAENDAPEQLVAKTPNKNAIIPVPNRPDPNTLNLKNIFGKSIRSDSERIDRLERAVQDMRNDFEMVRPSIRRLMAIEGDMQSLIGELEKLNNDTKPQPAVNKLVHTTPPNKSKTIKSHKAPKKNFVTKSPPPMSGKASVYDVRIGEHPGKTRIVMDTNSKTTFSVDIDNNEKIMVIDFPNANWSAAISKNFSRSPYISSYKVETSGNGHIAIFQLKKNAKISYKNDLKGFEGDSRRIVVDISG